MKKHNKNILFDLGHPGHVHLFKNFIIYLTGQKYNITVTSRDKDVTNELLDEYGLEYLSLSKATDSFFCKFCEFISRTWQILKLHRKKRFDYAFGTSVSIGWISLFSSVKSYVFNEDDDDTVPLFCWLAYPFATKICIPSCLRCKRWGSKRVKHNSYHELAYLHPANFAPDEKVLEKYGLEKNKYVIARFSSLKAHHDIGAKGILGKLWNSIQEQLGDLEIVISDEVSNAGERVESREPPIGIQIQPSEMHHIMAFAKILISDSQTMTIESAVLGVPAIRINTFIDKSTVLKEIENEYTLSFGFLPDQKEEILQSISDLMQNPDLEKEWQKKRVLMLADKIDLNQWMISLLTTDKYRF